MAASSAPTFSLRIGRRYRNRFYHGYAICKLATDPVYRAVADKVLTSDLPLLDLGCGIGLCAFYLRERGYKGSLHGVDFDQPKIAAARRLAEKRYRDVTFDTGDASNPQWLDQHATTPGHVLMLDVLHYFTPDTQQAVLTRMARTIAPGGWAVLRITPRDTSWRYRMTRWEEAFAQRFNWMKGPPQSFPTADEVAGPFRAAGFMEDIRPLWGRTPFNSYLMAFQRPA